MHFDVHRGTGFQHVLAGMCVKELDLCGFQLRDRQHGLQARATNEISNLEAQRSFELFNLKSWADSPCYSLIHKA